MFNKAIFTRSQALIIAMLFWSVSQHINVQYRVINGEGNYVVPFAIIDDKDGYSYVRNDNKQIIGRIYPNEVFAVPSEAFDNKGNYFYIEWNSKQLMGRKHDFDKQGFIHHSRIKYLRDLALLSKTITKNKVSFVGHNYQVVVTIGQFDPLKHKITYNSTRGIYYIDGYEVFGFEGDNFSQPKITEIAEISIIVEDKKYLIPQYYLTAFLSPTRENMFVAVSDDNTLFIAMTNGDGAAGYGVVWTVKKAQVQSVITFQDF